MTRTLKPQIHIFFPEASNRGSKIDLCEHFFVKHSFQRRVTKATIESYAEDREKDFKQALGNKRKGKLGASSDLFFIVLDTDITANRANLNHITSQIQSLKTKYNEAQIILSGRSFEVWLCMYGRLQYTAPYTTQKKLNSDVKHEYDKKEVWYRGNATRLYDEYPDAKLASVRSKQYVYQNTQSPTPTGFDLVNNLPDLSNPTVLQYLVKTTPFTYVEQLIDCLKRYE